MPEKQFISFGEPTLSASGRTKIWEVVNLYGTVLGHIKWYSKWRKYAFHPEPDMVFDPTCLDRISEFMGQQMKEHFA